MCLSSRSYLIAKLLNIFFLNSSFNSRHAIIIENHFANHAWYSCSVISVATKDQ